MFIPVPEGEVRRTPWITYALIAVNVLVHASLYWTPHADDWEATAEDRVLAIRNYWQDHPYLAVPPELEHNASGIVKTLREEIEEERGELGNGHPPGPLVLKDEQAELDRRAHNLILALELSPAHRYGYIPATKKPL